METFQEELDRHAELWGESLDETIPDYPIDNVDDVRRQSRELSRRIGTLRPFLARAMPSARMVHPAIGVEWDVVESATGLDIAQRKGPSIEALTQAVSSLLGELDAYHDHDEVPRDASLPVRPSTQKRPADLRQAQDRDGKEWDVFISHASEDKDSFVRPLSDALRARGLKVWYDEFTLQVGDSLRRSIDKGLAESRYGVVVLSHGFFSKEWPQRELDGLVAREIDGTKVILPVWHGVTFDDVRRYSPTLADKMAARSDQPLEQIVKSLLDVIGTGIREDS